MSSLLQHHGCTTEPKPGYVELLMYLTERYEQKPLSCSNCGHEWNGETCCAGCGAFVLFAKRYDAQYSPTLNNAGDHTTDLLTMDDAIERPEYRAADTTCWVSNGWSSRDVETVEHVRADGSRTTVPKLYRIWRKPRGMWGCWVVFQWNGEEHVPNLSTPIAVERLPRDAQPLTESESRDYWNS